MLHSEDDRSLVDVVVWVVFDKLISEITRYYKHI